MKKENKQRKVTRELIKFSIFTLVTVLALALILLLIHNEGKKHSIDYFSYDEAVYYVPVSATVEIKEFPNPMDDETQERVNEIGRGICNYFNETYNANWRYEEIKAYDLKLTKLNKISSITYGALYSQGAIVLDTKALEQLNDLQLDYVIAHELTHYLYDLNCKAGNWRLEKNGTYCGFYFEEATVDMLAKEFTVSRHPEEVSEETFETGYKFIRMYAESLKVAIPDYPRFFFVDDIAGLEKEFNAISKQYVKGDSKNFFKKYLSLIDATLEANDSQRLSKLASVELKFLYCITPAEKKEELNNVLASKDVTVVDSYAKYMHD